MLRVMKHTIELLRKEPFTFQLVLVDDGNTKEYMEKTINPFLGDYPNFVVQSVNQPHKGLRAAVLLGLRACTGPFIQKTDNDCLLPEGWFTFATKILDKVDAIAPGSSQSNARTLRLEKDKRPFRLGSILGGCWMVKAEKVEYARKKLTSAGGSGIWNGNVILECPLIKTYGWSTEFSVEDIGYQKGTHPDHIKSAEHRAYSREIGRKVSW